MYRRVSINTTKDTSKKNKNCKELILYNTDETTNQILEETAFELYTDNIYIEESTYKLIGSDI
jgi:hypothetical protein